MAQFLEFFEQLNALWGLTLIPLWEIITRIRSGKLSWKKQKREDIQGDQDTMEYLINKIDELVQEIIAGKLGEVEQKKIQIKLETTLEQIKLHCAECYQEVINKTEQDV